MPSASREHRCLPDSATPFPSYRFEPADLPVRRRGAGSTALLHPLLFVQ